MMHVSMIIDPDECVYDLDPRSSTLMHVCMMRVRMMHVSRMHVSMMHMSMILLSMMHIYDL